MALHARRLSQVIGLTAAVTILSAANAVAGMVGFSTFSAESYPLVAPSHFDVNWQVDGGDTPVTYAVNGQASVLRHLKPGWAGHGRRRR